MWVKADLHLHAWQPEESYIRYNEKRLINFLVKHNYKVASITLHDRFIDEKWISYAKDKGLLLIRGIEKTINKKHVLIYIKNNNKKLKQEILRLASFKQLVKLKTKYKDSVLVIAPHPFYKPQVSLGNLILKYASIFDAYELSMYYFSLYNPNKKMLRYAKKLNKPIIANQDLHCLSLYNKYHYTLLNINKLTANEVFNAVRDKKIKVITKPMHIKNIAFFLILEFYISLRNLVKGVANKFTYNTRNINKR